MNAPMNSQTRGRVSARLGLLAGLMVCITMLAAVPAAKDEGGIAGLPPECGIFVSVTGTDAVGNGLTPANPVRTITFGITRAVNEGLTCVFVRAGVYNEVVRLQNAVHVRGGFDMNWVPASYSTPGHLVHIVGEFDSIGQRYVEVTGENLTQPVSVSNLQITGPNAVGAVLGDGRTSQAIYLRNSWPVTLSELRVIAGNGAAGAAGTNGSNASQTAATAGSGGQNGWESSDLCDPSSRGNGGNGGTNPCSGSVSNGGAGGDGGTKDTSCGAFGLCSNCNATAGLNHVHHQRVWLSWRSRAPQLIHPRRERQCRPHYSRDRRHGGH